VKYTQEQAERVLDYCLENNLPLPGTPEEWSKIMEEINGARNP